MSLSAFKSALVAVLVLIAVLTTCQTTLAQNRAPSNTGRTWAVVVGVSRYPRLPGGQQLQFAENDATAFAQAIQKLGVNSQNIRVLTASLATTEAVKNTIGNWLALSASETDTVILFFSGHGFVEKQFGEAYILCSDSDTLAPYATALSIRELTDALKRRVKASRVLLIADIMRRDFFEPEAEVVSSILLDRMTEIESRPGASVILGSGRGEFSREGRAFGGYGIFTRSLLDAIASSPDSGGDGLLDAQELFETASSRVATETSNKQHPWRSAGQLNLIALGALPRSTAPQTARSTNTSAPPATSRPESSATAQVNPRPEEPSAPTPSIAPPIQRSGSSATDSRSPTRATPSTDPGSSAAQRPSTPRENNRQTVPDQRRTTTPPERRSASQPQIALERTSTAAPSASSSPTAPTTVTSGSDSRTAAAVDSNPATTATQPAIQPPRTAGSVSSANSIPASSSAIEPATVPVEEASAPPRPLTIVPAPLAVGPATSRERSAGTGSLPVPAAASAPSPVPMLIQVALNAGQLVEPAGNSAWDLYQRLVREAPTDPEIPRFRSVLAGELLKSGKSIVTSDVRADNVSNRVDDFRRAGQLLQRARSLQPDNAEAAALEKLGAAQALIALQFFDEAERALLSMQGTSNAFVENALGLVYRGKFDDWRAERAFKNSISLAPEWSAPHFNLAHLYLSQKKDEAIAEFEKAVSLDPQNAVFHAALGDIHFEKQRWESAIGAYRKAVTLRPDDSALHMKLGHSLYSHGLKDEADKEYQKARQLGAR